LRGAIYDPYIRYILWQGVRVWWRDDLEDWIRCPEELEFTSNATQPQSHQLGGQLTFLRSSKQPQLDQIPGCPLHWSRPIHSDITCSHTFPSAEPHGKAPELATDEYYGWVKNNTIVEKLLAMGGLRLAATLNEIFNDGDNPVATWQPWIEEGEARQAEGWWGRRWSRVWWRD